jgi:hypothetical protein
VAPPFDRPAEQHVPIAVQSVERLEVWHLKVAPIVPGDVQVALSFRPRSIDPEAGELTVADSSLALFVNMYCQLNVGARG